MCIGTYIIFTVNYSLFFYFLLWDAFTLAIICYMSLFKKRPTLGLFSKGSRNYNHVVTMIVWYYGLCVV